MHTTFTVGRLTCHALEGGRQHLDGGAMFGVVPKPLWERRITADARNRIPLALRLALVHCRAKLNSVSRLRCSARDCVADMTCGAELVNTASG